MQEKTCKKYDFHNAETRSLFMGHTQPYKQHSKHIEYNRIPVHCRGHLPGVTLINREIPASSTH